MNKKFADFFCNPKETAKNIAIFVLMLFLVIYAGFQILPSFSQKIETENAMLVSVYESNKTNGYIFRNETVITGDTSGKAVTLVKDGERVSKGQHFANIYLAEDYAELQQQANAIQDKIEVLEKSVVEVNAYVTDISKTDDEIDRYFDVIFKDVSEGNLSEISSHEDSLLVSLNKRELIVSMMEGYETEIAALRTEKAYLENRINSVSKRLTANMSGYYYGDTDGYEKIFTLDALDNLTLESFEQMTLSSPDYSVKNQSFGKIVESFVWYVVCETQKDIAAGYEENKYYTLNFPSFSDDEVHMKLEKIIKSTSEKNALLVFRGNTAPEGFTYQRNQQVDIISNRYSGLAVPKEAIRIIDGKRGVYILSGDIVRFRLVDIIGENEDYYIVSAESPKSESEDLQDETEHIVQIPYLALYDNVIVKGKNLFDGKIVG